MRIFVEQSGYPLLNMGDLAMLQVAVSRLKSLWPNALIEVLTISPELLTRSCPQANPVLTKGQKIWLAPISKGLYKRSPKFLGVHLSELEWWFRCNWPSVTKLLIQKRLKKNSSQDDLKDFELFLEAVEKADLVVAAGGGYITDTFEQKTRITLSILGLAKRLGKPTVMLGHGLGPLQKPELRHKAKAVLSSVDLISLREKRAGIQLLNSLNVPQSHVVVTGDDAIEMAYEARSEEIGGGIGINLRVAEYSGVNTGVVEAIRLALQEFAIQKNVPLLPVPIELRPPDSDVETIQKLLAGYDNASDGGQSLNTPLKVIQQAGRCRVVVTGSYHAGVFSLSQGIPIIGLAKSAYYKDKFLGLADQFGIGCEVVLLDDEQLQQKLTASINRAWCTADEVRPQLLAAAKRQINLGHSAYKRVHELIESRRS
ncbi:polysaccharide pyruvyl transferase family protein [Leptolyngbya sp. FACHB-261]|uniref:polysaccharide pyruvyl transferase family protein n=1 Tax=Leptolyngbya sp. FACHB-261 TaxID=2692806 RepID=UPI00168706E4|nr:polysaccharide pyruvyl transferase family protein [Leptolyngbya sp. FACHB-261]MBD2101135.1 polysaccharide pyruvyl transferase family protein [Leptolyngbya sp. FACHB-261]